MVLCASRLILSLIGLPVFSFDEVSWSNGSNTSLVQPLDARSRGLTTKRSLFSAEDDYDGDDEAIMGPIFTQFLPDSETQMIVDMDFFKHFFNYAEVYRDGIERGNVDLMRYAVEFVDRLKKFDVSSACIADALHYVWTAVEYATHVERHRNCTDCKCTPFFQQKKNERSWVFNDSWKLLEVFGDMLCISYQPVISIENYTIYCGDADENKVGGCAIAVRNDYKNLVEEFGSTSSRCAFLRLRDRGGRKLWIVSAHAPTETAEGDSKDAFYDENQCLDV
ncbi:hypothetical protein RB195_018793 [Necator americanus]|uniref:Nose resistant-to-fluoxetine protein N-terminal domain-containing protein n=1 Tax=Necator americanus TaxID=51031 RepID=A0ABR1CBA2_NECAM